MSGPSLVVLLVEDHLDTRQMYVMFMADRYQFMEAGSGAAALTLMRERRPDAVVTDLALPDGDGLQILAEMRRDTGLQDVPVICLSGYGDGDDTGRRARDAGFTRLLQIPCRPDTLADALEEVLGNRNQRGQEP